LNHVFNPVVAWVIDNNTRRGITILDFVDSLGMVRLSRVERGCVYQAGNQPEFEGNIWSPRNIVVLFLGGGMAPGQFSSIVCLFRENSRSLSWADDVALLSSLVSIPYKKRLVDHISRNRIPVVNGIKVGSKRSNVLGYCEFCSRGLNVNPRPLGTFKLVFRELKLRLNFVSLKLKLADGVADSSIDTGGGASKLFSSVGISFGCFRNLLGRASVSSGGVGINIGGRKSICPFA